MNAEANSASSGTPQAERARGAEHYRADIDGLRAIAVLAVVGFHAFPDYFPGGFVGVDVFFVISGFLISSIIFREVGRSTFTLPQFYARRIRRIFPALLIVLVACLLFGWFALLPDELEHLGKHVAAAATFVSNLALWQESGYFDRAAELKPLLHLWSLGVEEQFYLVWPMLLLLLWKRQQNIAITIVLLTLTSFMLSIALGQQSPSANFYFPFSRFWELGLGCLLAVVKESPGSLKRWFTKDCVTGFRYPSLSHHANSALPIVGLCLIGAAIFLFDRHTRFPGWAALVPTVGAMCVIHGCGDSWFQRRIMACAGLVLIGVISYPLYLWHWPILSFATILEAGTPGSIVRSVAVLLSVALAWLTFRLLECPLRYRRSTRVTLTLVGALSMFGVVGIAVYAASGFGKRFDYDVRAIRPEPRTNAVCVRSFPEDRVFNYCKSTSPAHPTAVFLGDSRAQGVYDGVVAVMGARHSLTLLGRGGCPPLLNVYVHDANDPGCNDAWSVFVKYIEKVKPPVVVLVGGGSSLLQGSAAAMEVQGRQFQTREDVFKHGLRELIVALQKTSRVIYVREIPSFDSAPSCFLRRITLPGSHCSPSVARSVMEEAMASYNRVVDELQGEMPELKVVASISALCDATTCSQKLRSGEIIYSDALHLSPAGGRHFARTSDLLSVMINQMRPST